MDKPIILTRAEIMAALENLPGWIFVDNKIRREYKFDNFTDSLNFVVTLAPFFEAHDHHPDVHILYSRVRFELQRFDLGGKVTDKDITIAEKIEDEYQKQPKL